MISIASTYEIYIRLIQGESGSSGFLHQTWMAGSRSGVLQTKGIFVSRPFSASKITKNIDRPNNGK